MLTFSTTKGPVATARGSVTIELLLLQPTLTFNYTPFRDRGEGLVREKKTAHFLSSRSGALSGEIKVIGCAVKPSPRPSPKGVENLARFTHEILARHSR